ncbi:MAG: M28 family peptidase [Gemmatimonadota bacterium]
MLASIDSPWIRVAFTVAALAALESPVALVGQSSGGNDPWFGLPLPPALTPHAPTVLIGDRGPVPARVPAGEEGFRELEGSAISRDLETIIGFSRESRADREIGSGQLWGRVAGFPSSRRTVEWTADQFRAAGIQHVEVQRFAQDDAASMWLPLSWEVRLLGDDAFGRGSADVVLESAMPLSPSQLVGGQLTAPVVFVGAGHPAELTGVDVRGRIAVQQVIPQAHMVFERSPTVPRAQELMRRGAVAVINVMKQPGNERARDFSNCGGPCFNLGGRDGHFLLNVLEEATAAGTLDRLRLHLELETGVAEGMTAENGVAVIPGSRSEETIILNAHADAWFDGAGDNGDGLAVLIALARHFAQPANRPERTLVFVASAGHHTPGINGPRSFLTMNPDLAGRAVVAVNIEHVAQRNLTPARSESADGYRETVADVGEAPIVAGVTNDSPLIENLFVRGVERYGTNFVSERSSMASGESGGYRQLEANVVTLMQAPPLYHTSGEVFEVISIPGLERMARFLAFFVKQLDQAPRERLGL